ncbi:MAG: hypothetical protein ACREHV_06440 [Rhizomicrobium sp.]
MERAPVITPSLIVAMTAEGDLFAETYRNGSRVKVPLFPGLEVAIIRDTLLEQAQHMRQEVQRAAEISDAKAKLLHRAVWANAAAKHGVGFANKTIGKAPGATKQAAQAKSTSAAISDIKQIMDLL